MSFLIAAAGNSAPVWTPDSIADLALWIDPSDPATLSLSGSNVLSITDKKGGLVFNHSGSAYVTLNTGHADLLCDTLAFSVHGNQHLTCSPRFLTASGAYTMLNTLYYPTGTGTYSYNGMIDGSTALQSGSDHWGAGTGGTADCGFDALAIRVPGSSKWAYTDGTSRARPAKVQATLRTTGVVGQAEIRWDGANKPMGDATLAHQMYLSVIGGYGGLYASAGQFGEFLVYNRSLTNDERNTVEAYLKAKWGTA